MNRSIILIAHNVRSCHNVGSLLRTADGLGVEKVWLSGYTPYPQSKGDKRLPHLAAKIDRQIAKTALGAEKSVTWQQTGDLDCVLADLKKGGYQIVALEQTPNATALDKFIPPAKIALLVGNEVDGLGNQELAVCDSVLEIPMLGKKESLNVTIAAGIALHHLRHA